MFLDRAVLVVVPARGESKGVKLKNIKPINGVPLVAMVGMTVKKLPFVDRAIVSTDHREIARIAKESGLDVPFYRPPELSGDFVSDWEVLNHALLTVEEMDKRNYDIIVMLQPTSPLRRPEHVYQAVEKLVKKDLDSVWTVSETDAKDHPLKQLKITGGHLGYHDTRGKEIIARQQLETVYHRDGIAYAMTRDCILGQKTIMGKKAGALIVEDLTVSIDTLWDFKLVEFIMNCGGKDGL